MENSYKKKTIKTSIVFGAARSGVAAAKLLTGKGKNVILIDESPTPKAVNSLQELKDLNISCRFGCINFDVLNDAELFILSPGISIQHPFVQAALKMKIRVESELELGSKNIHCHIIAITGTNGKTTVTTLIDSIMYDAGIMSSVAGNIGKAISQVAAESFVEDEKSVVVAEVSSFQLETIDTFHPHIALILNITPDHMDRYADFEEYKKAKFIITKNQTPIDFLILNYDDKHCMDLVRDTKATVNFFSSTYEVPEGAFVKDGKIFVKFHENIYIMEVNEIPLPGKHNLENVLASALAAFIAGVNPEVIRKSVMNFKGVEHRIEFCGEISGVRFFNDSKATNLDSLKVALESFKEPIILIAGGRGKETGYAQLLPLLKDHVKKLITLGEKAETLEKEWGISVPFVRANDMQEAVDISIKASSAGDIILLSPGHKSFDLYNNYEERGKHFKDSVKRRMQNEIIK